jgi:hypothetical protein
MKFFMSAVVLGLVTSVLATPIPQESSTDITKRLVELEDAVYGLISEKRETAIDVSSHLNHLEARVAIKDTKCPDNGKTYKKADIMAAVAAENAKTKPEKYGNMEGKKKLFATNDQLYKASLDSKLLFFHPLPPAVNSNSLDLVF